MVIHTSDLSKIINKLIQHIEEQKINQVVINEDYYWTIPKSQRNDVYTQPTNFTIGQLTADWEELTKLIAQDKVPIGYHFVWLSEILRAIGEELTY